MSLTYAWVDILGSALEDVSSVLRPVRAAGELVNEDIGEVVVFAMG